MQETKNLNIPKILWYGAPKGLPLYSPICGECKFENCTSEIIKVSTKDQYFHFYKNGQYYENQGECLLFPSKDHRMWDGWQKILLPQSIGSICATNEPNPKLYLCDSKGLIMVNGNYFDFWKQIPTRSIELLGYASPEETKQFFTMLKSWDREWDGKKIIEKQCDEQRWRDNTSAKINGYYVDSLSSTIHRIWPAGVFNKEQYFNTFATKKQAKSALAMARISQIMAHDKRFGGVVTDEEWRSGIVVATIDRIDNLPRPNLGARMYRFLAFHTEEQRDLFLKENKDLVKDYLMINE